MAAYMRKTGILPVCTNNEARAYFAGKGLTYADVTEGDILTLVMLLNKHIKKANADCETSMGSMYLSRRIDLKRKTNGALISCFLYVNSHYFERRECMSNAVKVKRAGFGQAYYDAYANTTTTPEKEEITMSNSPLVTYTNITAHKNSPRNHAIDTITIHCIVGQWTAKQGCDYFATTDRECSANYIVGKDGSIGLSVDEADRSWCTSSRENDNRAVTIEVASDTEHPYAVTDAAYAALIKLVADICKRNGIKKLVWSTNKTDRVSHANGCNMTVHRDYANKACPGQYLYDRHGAIAAAVNEILGSSTTQAPEAAPEAVQGFPETPFTVRVIVPDLNYRKGPGMSYAVKGQTGKGVFTITEVQDGWGKLKSGAGWIYLENPDYCTIQGVATKPAEPDPADVLAQEIAGKVKGSGLDPSDVLARTKKSLGVA